MKTENEFCQQKTDLNPTQWGKFEELFSDTYRGYPIIENLEKIYDIGEHKIAYVDGDKTFYLSMSKKSMSKKRPILSSSSSIGHPLKEMISWPMCKHDGKIGKDPKMRNYEFYRRGEKVSFRFSDSQGIENPVLHPQFVFLGMNWSGENHADTSRTDHVVWKNGYSQQARIFLDSVLSGGYFTDFIKFYKATKLTDQDKCSLYEDKVKLDNDEKDFINSIGKPITWFEVYVNIFRQELEMLTRAFQKPEYIIIWGAMLYKFLYDASMEVYKKEFQELFHDYKIRVFGCHYAGPACAHTFPLDEKESEKLRCSCRRIYEVFGDYDQSVMKKDRLLVDERRYEFALIKDNEGQLQAYKGNPKK